MAPRPKKPSAAERTLDMYAPPAPEVLVEEAKAERISIPEDANRMRETTFQVQEWTSRCFGLKTGPANEYRVTNRNGYYYLESVSEARYCGLMIPEADLYNLTNVLLAAARAKKERESYGF